MLGEGGYKVAPKEFFIPLFEECKKHNIGIWADEVQTFLRTGEPFAFQTLGFAQYVDVCTIAKTAQCGMTPLHKRLQSKAGPGGWNFFQFIDGFGGGTCHYGDDGKSELFWPSG